jgi:RHS repeat-associated protein
MPPSAVRSSPAASDARKVPVGSEVLSRRTQTSRTYTRSRGGLRTEVTPGSQNYKDASGNWQSIDNTLVPTSASGYRYQNKANQYRLMLPADLSRAPVQLVRGSAWAKTRLLGASGAPRASGNQATYAGALPAVNVTYSATNDAVEEELTLADTSATRSFQYALSLSPGLSPLVHDGSVELRSASGTWLVLSAPFMHDSASTPVYSHSLRLGLTRSSGGWTMSLEPDAAWLADPARVWPVVIDPTAQYPLNTNCYIGNGSSANSNFCAPANLNVGFDGSTVFRTLLNFDIAEDPDDTIVDASLQLELSSDQISQAQSVELHAITGSWDSGVTWNQAQSNGTLWHNPGGDFNATAQSSISVGPGTNVDYAWPLTSLVQSWVNQSVAANGLLLKVANEGQTGLLQFYGSGSTCQPTCRQPRLVVDSFHGLGVQPWYKLDRRKLSDRMQLAVNLENQNLVLQANDFSIQGTGLNLNVSRIYNSMAFETDTDLADNWTLNVGKDVFLETGAGHPSWDGPIFHQPDGSVVKFTQNGSTFTPPAGLHASLAQVDSTHWRLTYNQSAEKLNFTNLSDPNCVGCAYETSDQDRNANTITFGYDGSFRLSTITDTQSRQITLAYTNSSNSTIVTAMTDSSGRQWQYGYDANAANLTSATDPANKITHFTYDSFPQVSQIQDARGNVIVPGYDANGLLTSLGYQNSDCAGATCTYTYTHNSGTSGVCTASGVQDNLTRADPLGHTTRYCFDFSLRALQTFDALGHSRQATYTLNNDAQNLTDSLSQVSQLSYDLSNNLTQIQAPASASGQTAASNFFSYHATGQAFLPSSRTDAQGNCRAFTYDTAGNLSDVYDGQASSGSPPQCDGQTGGAHLANRYQGDPGVSCSPAKNGELCSTIDAKGNTTNYGYNSNGNLTSISPPSPLGSTSIVPDALSRLSSVTDGKAQKTTYTYDNLDRITQILYGGATSCTSSATCTTFSYDEDGNLTSRADNTGTTTFSYDTMNRVKTKSLPDSSMVCTGSGGLTFTYDDADHLKAYCDAGGTVSYGFDAANRLTALAEPGGSVTSGGACNASPCTSFTYDNDDRRTQAHFPGGATLNLTYDNSGNQLTAIGKDSSNNVLTSFTYTYRQGTNDRQLRQSVLEQDTLASNRTTTYTHDAINRLTDATPNDGSTTYHYRYDANGNRCRTDTTACQGASDPYQYNATDELTASPGVSSWSYDGDGNVSGNSAGASLSYNSKNQTTAVTYGGQTLSPLAYADLSQTERTQAASTSFASGPLGVQIAKSGATSTFYTRDDKGNLIGERTPDGNRWYYLKDGLGSVVAVISQSGSIGNRYGYDPYGKVVTSSGMVANPWGYAGGYLDPTGLVKFGSRFYDPNLGRWTQRDAITGNVASPQSIDRFVYVADDPATMVDPSGYGIGLDWIGYAAATVGFGLAAVGLVAAVAVSAPVWLTVLAVATFVVATVALYVAADTVACDSGFGIWCG